MLSKAKIAEVVKNKYNMRISADAKEALKNHVDDTDIGIKLLKPMADLAKSQKKKTISGPMAVACIMSWKLGCESK